MIFRIVWFILSTGLVAFSAINWYNEEHNKEHISNLIYAPLGVIGVVCIVIILGIEQSLQEAKDNAKWQAKKKDGQ